MLDDRLTAGRGFAAFGPPSFTGGVVARYLRLDREVRHLVLVHHADTAPALVETIGAACAEHRVAFRPVPWAEYGDPSNVAHVGALPPSGLVFVSADHHKSVRDRLDPRRGYIRRKTARRKIALDTIPYEVAPWRVFFPFGFFDRDLMGYHHSYALEQDYEKSLDGLSDNPCTAERLAGLTWRAAVVTESPVFDRLPEVTEIPASAKDHEEYAVERDRLFDTEKSIASVKAKLARWIQERYPARELPADLKRVYEPAFDGLVATDLPFDRWVVREVVGLMTHTNELLRRWAELAREAGG